MWSITKKELLHFWGNPIGYMAVAIYLICNWLYLFIFPDTNLFDYKYATLSTYFEMAPWVFMLLIPAIAMRSFSEEFRSGTIERLLTLPISIEQVVIGKYLACVLISLVCVGFTIPFLITVNSLADASGFDVGATLAGYVALVFLSCTFNAIAVFASIIQRQMIIAFFVGVCLCFIFFVAFQSLSYLKIAEGYWDYYLQLWGIQSHYNSMRRGVLSVADVVYFGSVSAFFLFLSVHYLHRFVKHK